MKKKIEIRIDEDNDEDCNASGDIQAVEEEKLGLEKGLEFFHENHAQALQGDCPKTCVEQIMVTRLSDCFIDVEIKLEFVQRLYMQTVRM